jgi:hypothetical protein
MSHKERTALEISTGIEKITIKANNRLLWARYKVHHRTGPEGPKGEQRESSTLSLTSTLHGGGWLTPRPGRFTPEKETRFPFYRRPGGPQGRSGRVRKTSPSQGIDPRTIQPLASRSTDWAIAAHVVNKVTHLIVLLKQFSLSLQSIKAYGGLEVSFTFWPL